MIKNDIEFLERLRSEVEGETGERVIGKQTLYRILTLALRSRPIGEAGQGTDTTKEKKS